MGQMYCLKEIFGLDIFSENCGKFNQIMIKFYKM